MKYATKFRTALLTGALAAMSAVSGPGNTLAQNFEIKVSLFTPPVNPFSVEMERVGKEIGEKSGGRLKLNIFHASQLGPAPRQFDLVRTGVADMAVVFHGLTPGRFPMTQLVELPGLAETTAGLPAAMTMLELLPEYLASEYPDVKLLNYAITPNPIIISRTQFRSLADLKDKRIRHPGAVHSATITALGAVPVLVQPFEMAEALRRGQIDGAVTGTGASISFKLHEVAPFILEMPIGRLANSVVMNAAVYERIPADLRGVFDEYFGPKGQKAWGMLLDRTEAADRETIIKEGVKASLLDDKDLAEFSKIAISLQESAVNEFEKKGMAARAYLTKLKEGIARHK